MIRAERGVIKVVFAELLRHKDSVTTLDVKKALREDGYRVTQSEVSAACAEYYREHANEGNIWRYFKINHFVYQGNVPTQEVAPEAPRKAEPATQEERDWWVFHDNYRSPVALMENMTRNQARYQYAKKHHVKYTEVRTAVRKARKTMPF